MEDADAMVASSFGLVQLYRLLFWAMHIFDPLVSGLLGCALTVLSTERGKKVYTLPAKLFISD